MATTTMSYDHYTGNGHHHNNRASELNDIELSPTSTIISDIELYQIPNNISPYDDIDGRDQSISSASSSMNHNTELYRLQSNKVQSDDITIEPINGYNNHYHHCNHNATSDQYSPHDNTDNNKSTTSGIINKLRSPIKQLKNKQFTNLSGLTQPINQATSTYNVALDPDLPDKFDSNVTLNSKFQRFTMHVVTLLVGAILCVVDASFVISKAVDKSLNSNKTIMNLQYAILSFFIIDIILRAMALRILFLKNKLMLIDAAVTFTCLFFSLDIVNNVYVNSVLATSFEAARIGIRFWFVWHIGARSARAMVSTNKQRYTLHGFDLDLTYITDRIIAMGLPSTKIEAVYRNPIAQVAKFFNSIHHNHYLLVNLCSERAYPVRLFHHRVLRVPFDDHNPPPLSTLLHFCIILDKFLQQSPDNVVGIHCFPDDHQLLTSSGFKFVTDISESDKLATYNSTTQQIEYHKPYNVIHQPHGEYEMIDFIEQGDDCVVGDDGVHVSDYGGWNAQSNLQSSNRVNIRVTTGHRMYCKTSNTVQWQNSADSDWHVVEADQLLHTKAIKFMSREVANAGGGNAAVGNHDQWALNCTADRDILLHTDRDVKRSTYTGQVHCVTVPNGLVIARRAHQSSQGIITNASTPIVVGNCKGGKGRTGTMIAAWLLYSNHSMYTEQALKYFAMQRTSTDIAGKIQGVGGPSQKRYIQYFEDLRFVGKSRGTQLRDCFDLLAQPVELLSLTFHHVTPVKTKNKFINISNKLDDKYRDEQRLNWTAAQNWSLLITHYPPRQYISVDNTNDTRGIDVESVNAFYMRRYEDYDEFVFRAKIKNSDESNDYMSESTDSIQFDLSSLYNSTLCLAGDLKFQLFRGNLHLNESQTSTVDSIHNTDNDTNKPYCYCWFWLNSTFLPQSSNQLILRKDQIDEACKNSRCDGEFSMYLQYNNPPKHSHHKHNHNNTQGKKYTNKTVEQDEDFDTISDDELSENSNNNTVRLQSIRAQQMNESNDDDSPI